MSAKWMYDGVEFKVGDTVMVMDVEAGDAPNGMGEGRPWYNSWQADPMNDAIFNKYEIYQIVDEGVYFVQDVDDEASQYMYPLSVLKKVA